MHDDDRDILEVLRFELNFLEQGGYGRSVRTPWKPTSVFQDSLTCLNFNEPSRPHPCNECLLYDFVPSQARAESVPCHHIQLNESGQTVATIDRGSNSEMLQEELIRWLRQTIARIERERSDAARRKAV
jgi:hypothetical protein